jgi:acetoin utilization deacetylase AcuC-like enzyme
MQLYKYRYNKLSKLKIIFDEKFYNSQYAQDPAASSGRLESIMVEFEAKRDLYEIASPQNATRDDILRAHSKRHLNYVEQDPQLYDLAMLAAGASITAAQEAFDGNPSFAVVRPPGHHASSDSSWGFCYFNNISVSLLSLFSQGKIKSAFILDFDLHVGDGNINILSERDDGFEVDIFNPGDMDAMSYMNLVREVMESITDADILVAAAGFDQGISDWGNLLSEENYYDLGQLMKHHSERLCNGRRYALLEGGYNHSVLGKHTEAFCRGLL